MSRSPRRSRDFPIEFRNIVFFLFAGNLFLFFANFLRENDFRAQIIPCFSIHNSLTNPLENSEARHRSCSLFFEKILISFWQQLGPFPRTMLEPFPRTMLIQFPDNFSFIWKKVNTVFCFFRFRRFTFFLALSGERVLKTFKKRVRKNLKKSEHDR